MKKLLLATVVAAGVATGAQANEFDVSGYLQGSAGAAIISKKFANDVNDENLKGAGWGDYSSVDRASFAYKMVVGLQLNKYMALETQYADLGKVKSEFSNRGKDGKNNFKAKGFGVNAVGILPLADSFKLFGKFGYHSIKATQTGDVDSGSLKKGSKSYGAGMLLGVTDNLEIVGEYETYRKIAKVKNYHIDLVSAGIRYKF